MYTRYTNNVFFLLFWTHKKKDTREKKWFLRRLWFKYPPLVFSTTGSQKLQPNGRAINQALKTTCACSYESYYFFPYKENLGAKPKPFHSRDDDDDCRSFFLSFFHSFHAHCSNASRAAWLLCLLNHFKGLEFSSFSSFHIFSLSLSFLIIFITSCQLLSFLSLRFYCRRVSWFARAHLCRHADATELRGSKQPSVIHKSQPTFSPWRLVHFILPDDYSELVAPVGRMSSWKCEYHATSTVFKNRFLLAMK